MKKIFLILIVSLSLLTACQKNDLNDNFKIGYSTNMKSKEDMEEIKKVLEENKLSNIPLFFSWVEDFNKNDDNGCGIKNWSLTNDFSYNEVACTDRYEKDYDISDGNCRLTAYSLIQDKIKINKTIKDYGSYLMFDVDVLENNSNYKKINDHFDEFITLYNEMNIENIDNDKLREVFPNKWDDYQISLKDDNVSLISFVIHDEYSKVLFIGHTGVLIKLDNKYLFIEKIAFEQPYQVSIIKDIDDLKNIFKERKNYFGDNNEQGPFVYQNDKLIFEY